MIADLIVRHASVRTLDPRRPTAESVAIVDGVVAAVGADDTIAALRGPATRVLDAAGATVLPGLVDGHIHPVLGVDMTTGADLTRCVTLDQVRSALAAQAQNTPSDAWVRAWGLDPNVFAGVAIERHALDDVVGGRPAVVLLFDGHAALTSSAALQAAGVTGPRSFDSSAAVVCATDGVPTGHLLEEEAIALVLGALPATDPMDRRRALADVLRRLAASGLTGGHVMDLADTDVSVYRALEESGELPMRLRLAPWCRPGDGPQRWAELLELQREHGHTWEVGAVKFFLDGTIDGGTAWLREPDRNGGSDAPYWSDLAEYAEAVSTFADAGVQTATHAIGDAAVAHVLDTLAAVVPRGSRVRHRIEHIETLDDDQVPRFAELDVIASMQPIHATDFTSADHSDNWSERIGAARAERGWRYRDLLDAGATVLLGSDWPVAEFDPRVVLATAQTRRPVRRPTHLPVGPQQRLSPSEALAGYTIAAAYATGDEHRAGRIRAGFRADLTILAADPLTVSPSELPEVAVVATVVNGIVYHGADLVDAG